MKKKIVLIVFSCLLTFVFWDCKNSTTKKEKKQSLTTEQKTIYLDKGKQIAAATFTALSQQLQKAVKEGGIPNAIQYCNLSAYPITDSLSQTHQAQIRRTSLKNRNPKNSPSALEKEVLEAFSAKVVAGQPLKPVIKSLDNQTIGFFAPIMVNDFCLKCHGKIGEALTEMDNKTIKQFYPMDKATGYAGGNLRGMWSISFKK